MTAEPFRYRGFDCLLVCIAPDRIGGIVFIDQAPTQVVWSKRTFWHSRQRAKTMITQYIRHLPMTLNGDCGGLRQELSSVDGSSKPVKNLDDRPAAF